MGVTLDHIRGETFHGRKGEIDHKFRYGVDYVMCDFDASPKTPRLFSRDRRNITALWTKDHGGEVGKGMGADWVRAVLIDQGLTRFLTAKITLLAQPRIFGAGFNPVSFWLVHTGDDLRLVIAEVNNTFSERHSYLCHKDDFSPITREDHLHARKIFYVSPFQPVAGDYEFRFDITPQKIGVWINYTSGDDGVYATFTGARSRLTNGSILRSLITRPFGFLRVSALIYFEALRLKLKGAVYAVRGTPPSEGVSR